MVAKQSRREGVYNRTGDLSVTCFGKEERYKVRDDVVGAGGPELRSAFVCSANLRFIDLWFESTLFYIKITNRKSDWLFLVGAGGPELRSAFVCSANLRFIDLWFESTLFYIKITNRKSDWLFL